MKLILTSLIFLSSLALSAQDFALKILEDSPRHHEWAEVSYGDRTVHCFVAYPEVSEKATAVIVIHENRGLTDWVRAFADELAEAGYLAIAPDLLSGFSDETPKTSDFASSDDARNAIYQLNADQVTADLNAVRDYIAAVPSCNGKTAVAGFCWGGSQSFRMATNNDDIAVAMVFYGSPPSEPSEIARIDMPVYGFYGESDERINSTIDATVDMMEEHGKFYQPVIYEGVGHAYMRRGNDPESEADFRAAFEASFERITTILEGI